MHIRAALRNGVTPDEIKEVLLQTAIYCGVPAANSAFAVAQEVLAEEPRHEPRRRALGGADPGRAVWRRPGRRAPGRPGGSRSGRGCGAIRGRSGGDRGRLPRLREPGGRGQPQRRPDGGAAGGPARLGCRRDGEPALCLGPLGRRRRLPRDRSRRRRPLRGGRRRVDEPCAARDRQAGCRLPARRPDDVRLDPRLALPEPGHGGQVPARVDGRDGRERGRPLERLARGPGRVRLALAAALGGSADFSDELDPGRRARARRAPKARHDGGEARGPEARLPQGRHGHGRQLERPERRRRGARDRLGGEGARVGDRAARSVRRERRCRRRPARDGDRPRAGGAQAAGPRRRSMSATSIWSS